MKKLIPLLLIALMVVILGSCGINKEPIVLHDPEDGTPDVTEEVAVPETSDIDSDDSHTETVPEQNDDVLNESTTPQETNLPKSTTEETKPMAETEPTTTATTTAFPTTETEHLQAAEYEIVDTTGIRYAKDNVNVRNAPSVSGERVGHLDKGEKVSITGLVDNGWVRIKFKDGEYFVSGNYLSETAVTVMTTDIAKPGGEDSPTASNPLVNGDMISLPNGIVFDMKNVDRIVYDTPDPADINPEMTDSAKISEVISMLKSIEFGDPKEGGWVGGPSILFYADGELILHIMINDDALMILNQGAANVYPAISGAWTTREWESHFPVLRKLEYTKLSEYDIYRNKDITVSVDQSSVSNTTAEYTITNNTGIEIFFYEDIIIETQYGGKWYSIEPYEYDSPMEINIVSPSESYNAIGRWFARYGNLPAGEYRIVIRVNIGEFGGRNGKEVFVTTGFNIP